MHHYKYLYLPGVQDVAPAGCAPVIAHERETGEVVRIVESFSKHCTPGTPGHADLSTNPLHAAVLAQMEAPAQ